MRHICVHGAKCGTDAVVAECSQPAGRPTRLVGVGAEHVDEQDVREMVQDQRAADGGGLDLGDQQFAQVCQECTSRICGMDVHKRRQNIDQYPAAVRPVAARWAMTWSPTRDATWWNAPTRSSSSGVAWPPSYDKLAVIFRGGAVLRAITLWVKDLA